MSAIAFRLQKLVAERIADKTANGLATDIQNKTGNPISRKTLAKIANDPEHVAFNLHILRTLDAYFARDGEGLRDKPIFVQPRLIECLGGPKPVRFLLAAKPWRALRTYFITRWDTRSLAEVLRQMSGEDRAAGTEMRFQIEDVTLEDPSERKKLRGEKWHQLVEDDNESLVAIGSPHALLASELMLAKMFDVEPFVAPRGGFGFEGAMPFYFAWPKKHWNRPHSAFALDWRHLDPRGPHRLKERIEQSKIWAFVMGKQVHVVELQKGVWTMYGTIVAQRRKGNHVWLVISGLTGPATYAGARLLKDIKAELPWPKRGRHGGVLWQPFETIIKNDASRRDEEVDVREYHSVRPLGEPRVWQADETKPQSDEP